MVFAQITSGVIVNTIILNDITILPYFLINRTTGIPYDQVIQVDMIYPQPGIGWSFDNVKFVPPEEPVEIEEEPEEE